MTALPDFERDFSTIAEFLAWWVQSPVLQPPHDEVFNTYYAGYRNHFGSYIRHHYTDQTREIVELIRACNSPRLLEVGGGCGTEALWFALHGARVVAVDVNAERIGVARERQAVVERAIGRPLDLEFRFNSLFDLDESGTFDLIWMEQAFHHVEPREEVYPAISRLLAPEGRIVISEANGWNPLVQMVLLRRRGLQMVVERTTADGRRILYGNERITVPSALARGFESAGITRESVRYFRALPNIPAADKLIPLEQAIPRFIAPVFSHYNYVGRKPAAT